MTVRSVAGKGFYCSVKAERNAVYGSVFRQGDRHQERTYNSTGRADKHCLYVVGKCWLEGLDSLTGHDGKTGNAVFASAVCQLFQFRNLGFFKTKYQGAVSGKGKIEVSGELIHEFVPSHIKTGF